MIHAICDALLGASALGDIGKHFPDTKSKFKNISSLILLKKVSTLLKENNFEISNIDSTIVLQSPKIISFVDEMRNKISSVLEIELNQISIKATTNENLDAIGNEKGIAAHAVALIFKNKMEQITQFVFHSIQFGFTFQFSFCMARKYFSSRAERFVNCILWFINFTSDN